MLTMIYFMHRILETIQLLYIILIKENLALLTERRTEPEFNKFGHPSRSVMTPWISVGSVVVESVDNQTNTITITGLLCL